MSFRWLLLSWIAFANLALAAPITFNAALDRAQRVSPALVAKSARIDASRSAAIAADALPDPKLFAGVDNLPINGPDRWSFERDFMTMQKIGVMQDVPNSDKRRARAESAQAGIARAEAERRVEVQRLRRETAIAWLNRYHLERRVALFEELDRENQLFAETVRAQLAGGRGQPADVVMPKQEAAQLADRRDELARDLAKAKSELRRLVGADGDEPLAGEPPTLPLVADEVHQHVRQHPELVAFSPMLREAQAQVREAEAMKKPDWGLQLAYQRRGPQFSDMVSLQLTIDLPLFAPTRQDPQIAAKRQELLRIDAERDAMLRDHTAELDADLAEYAALGRQLQRQDREWLPLARERVDLQMASYRSGKGMLEPVLSARRESIEQRLKQIELQSKRDIVAAKIYFAYGEVTP